MSKVLERIKQTPKFIGYLVVAGFAVVVAGALDKFDGKNVSYSNNSDDNDENEIIPRAHASDTSGGGSCQGGGSGGGGGCGGGSGGCCFLSDETVLTSEGERKISDVKPGMSVVSYDDRENALTTSTVGQVFVHNKNEHDFSTKPLLSVKIQDEGGDEYVTNVTANHPYFDPVEGKYREIGELETGDLVRMKSGTGKILSKESIADSSENAPDSVYNLHMESGPPSYLVNYTVVHNKGGSGGGCR